jgi:excisionase family DNA binding protein
MELTMHFDISLSTDETMPKLEDYFTTQEAAEELDLHVETVRLFLRYKKLDGMKIGRTWLIPKKAVEEYQEKNKHKEKHDPTRD